MQPQRFSYFVEVSQQCQQVTLQKILTEKDEWITSY